MSQDKNLNLSEAAMDILNGNRKDKDSKQDSFGQGQTVTTPKSTVQVEQPEARMFVFNAGVDLDTIVRAVNQVGAAPGDLVAILEALKQAGALRADLIVI